MAVSRRALLGAGAAGGLAVAGLGCASSPPQDRIGFRGRHQAGIATPAQDRRHFAAFDVVGTRAELRVLLREWTVAAERMAAGRLAGTDGNMLLPPPTQARRWGSPGSAHPVGLEKSVLAMGACR